MKKKEKQQKSLIESLSKQQLNQASEEQGKLQQEIFILSTENQSLKKINEEVVAENLNLKKQILQTSQQSQEKRLQEVVNQLEEENKFLF